MKDNKTAMKKQSLRFQTDYNDYVARPYAYMAINFIADTIFDATSWARGIQQYIATRGEMYGYTAMGT